MKFISDTGHAPKKEATRETLVVKVESLLDGYLITDRQRERGSNRDREREREIPRGLEGWRVG